MARSESHEEEPIQRRPDGQDSARCGHGPVAEVATRHAVSEQTIYAWRKRYGELEVSDVRRLRELEQENARLKRIVAERDLEIDVMREIAQKKW